MYTVYPQKKDGMATHVSRSFTVDAFGLSPF